MPQKAALSMTAPAAETQKNNTPFECAAAKSGYSRKVTKNGTANKGVYPRIFCADIRFYDTITS